MTTNIARISQIAKDKPKEIFTSVYHMIDIELLKECYDELDGSKAKGIDGVTKIEYGNELGKQVIKMIMKWLNRRSQKKSYTKEGFNQMIEKFKIPMPRIKVKILAI